MSGVLIALLVVPSAVGLVGLLLGKRFAPWLAAAGSLATLILAALLAFKVDASAHQAAVDVSERWIPALGIRFHVAIDGLNAILVAMTSFVWLIGTVWSIRDRDTTSTPAYFFLLGLAQTAVLGAFVAQDLMLFVLCFDLMLLPFVVITATAAGPGQDGLRPAIVMLVYTLVGSLLMLVAAVALAILSARAAQAPVTFDLATLQTTTLSPGTQRWILAALLAAFLIKMPIAPFHGWFPAAYKAMPFPALVIFAAVLSKVAAYGLLKIALPILPDAFVSWRLGLVILALISILYASLVAFTSNEPRLILGYSSIAQLGFILLGITSLDPAGAQGAIFQMVTHALVVVPAIILVAVITERAGGVERLDQLGGLAKRAPVLTAIFLVVALAWLAMPGSGNFVAEYLVLLGSWRTSPWAAIIASIGVVLAAAYALRFMITAMQNARGAAIAEDSPDVGPFDAAVLGLAVGALVLVALVPQLGLHPSESASRAAVGPAQALYDSEHPSHRPPAANAAAPEIAPAGASNGGGDNGSGISVQEVEPDGTTPIDSAQEPNN
ncbi:MAG: NADH-quinone oxidoreductase subunit M [Solirubrobacteraceae bacterium]|nr:NADH-quinone oxidoreductase subunit M [Patulibacter sp.]